MLIFRFGDCCQPSSAYPPPKTPKGKKKERGGKKKDITHLPAYPRPPGQLGVGVEVDVEIVGAGVAAPLLRRHDLGRVRVVRLAVVLRVPRRARIDDLHHDRAACRAAVFAAVRARVAHPEAGWLGALRGGFGARGSDVVHVERGAGFFVAGGKGLGSGFVGWGEGQGKWFAGDVE